MTKQLKPFGACAKIRKPSHIGADMNNLWPCSRKLPSPEGSARVTLARRSEPPWFSVMPMPINAAPFCDAGTKRGSYWRPKIRGSHSAATAGDCFKVGTEP